MILKSLASLTLFMLFSPYAQGVNQQTAQGLLRSESALRQKFAELYAKDADVSHSVNFLADDSVVSYEHRFV